MGEMPAVVLEGHDGIAVETRPAPTPGHGEAAEHMVDLADAVRPLVTHRFPLDRYAEALEAMRSPDAVEVQLV